MGRTRGSARPPRQLNPVSGHPREPAQSVDVTVASAVPVPAEAGAALSDGVGSGVCVSFPRGTDLPQHSHEYLDAIAAKLNSRTRKTPGRETPAERLHKPLVVAVVTAVKGRAALASYSAPPVTAGCIGPPCTRSGR